MAFLFFLFCPLGFDAFVIESTQVPRFLLASGFLVILFAVLFVKKATLNVPNKWILGLFFVFYGLNLISLFWSFNKADSLFESQKVLLGLGGLVWFYHTIQDPKKKVNLVHALIVSGLALSIYSFFELFNQTNGNEAYSFTLAGHENLLSSLLFLFLPFCFSGFTSGTKHWKIISSITGLLILTLILLIGTRSVLFGLFGAILFFVFIKFLLYKTVIIRRISFALGGIIVIGAILFLINYAKQEQTGSKTEIASLNERFLLWDKTTQLIQESPVIGIGAGNWQYNYSKFSVADIDKANFYNIFFKRPHNDFLWIMAEVGVLGFLILLVAIILISKQHISQFFKTKNTSALIFLASLVGLLLISFFSFPKERISHICLTAILLAFVLKDLPVQKVDFKNKKLNLSLFLLIGLLFNVFLGYQRLKGEFYTKKSLFYQDQNNPELAIKNGLSAYSSLYTSDPTGTPIMSYIGWGYNATNQVDLLYTASRNAALLSPFNYKVLSNYGSALIRNHQLNEAKKVLLEAYRINPNYEPTNLNLSVVAFNQEDYALGLEWLKKIPNYELKYASNLARFKEKLDSCLPK